jgi:hypothetical protein
MQIRLCIPNSSITTCSIINYSKQSGALACCTSLQANLVHNNLLTTFLVKGAFFLCLYPSGRRRDPAEMVYNKVVCNKLVRNKLVYNKVVYNKVVCKRLVCNKSEYNKVVYKVGVHKVVQGGCHQGPRSLAFELYNYIGSCKLFNGRL